VLGWAELVSIATSSAGQHAPMEGFRALWRDEWNTVGAWTMSERSDHFDVAPFGWVLSSSGERVDELTWSKPGDVPVAAFDLYVVDAPGAGDWQYRVDDGPWSNVGPGADANVNRLRRVVVDTPVNDRVQIRGSNGRDACVAAVAGIDVHLDTPAPHDIRVHDLSAGKHFLSQFCRPTEGDPLALLDEIQPALVIVAFTNDVLWRAPIKFENALRAIVDRVAPFGDTLLIGAYEQRPPRIVRDAVVTSGSRVVTSDAATFLPSDVGEKLLSATLPDAPNTVITSVQSTCEATMSAPATDDSRAAELTIGFGRAVEEQALYRAIVREVAASTGSASLDIYEAWSKLGATGWAETFEAGLMADRYHASSLGHRDIAGRLLELVGSAGAE
jgi:hypothetical protein